jgi:serine/threonine protein kinase
MYDTILFYTYIHTLICIYLQTHPDFGLLRYKMTALADALQAGGGCAGRWPGRAGPDLGPECDMGTPYFMAPERLRGETGPSRPADVYSFGILIFEGALSLSCALLPLTLAL